MSTISWGGPEVESSGNGTGSGNGRNSDVSDSNNCSGNESYDEIEDMHLSLSILCLQRTPASHF